MQWHADNSMAGGGGRIRATPAEWRLQEAYMRELGRAIAAGWRRFDTFVAASATAKVELEQQSFLVDQR